jgi:hypothetical protein
VREGLGFNKSPSEYGAFPADPYSHTPKHAGAQQPGMTGQVKEEILTRFGELGLRVDGGSVRFETSLLRPSEFCEEPGSLRFLDVDGEWQQMTVPSGSLAFTWCQVPFVYTVSDGGTHGVRVHSSDAAPRTIEQPALPREIADELFARSGLIRRVELFIEASQLFAG